MKNLILIPILFLSLMLSAQTYIPVKPSQLPAASTINPTDLFILNQGTTTKKVTYSILNTVLKDTFATKNALRDTAAAIRASGGGSSTVLAGDGLTKVVNTISLGGNYDNNVTIGSTSGKYYYVRSVKANGTDETSFFLDTTLYQVVSRQDASNYSEFDILPNGSLLMRAVKNGNSSDIVTDSTVHAIYDTTKTDYNSIMTESQTKREINAMDGGWRKRANATKYYEGISRDSIVILNTGEMIMYKSNYNSLRITTKGIIEQQWESWDYPNTMMGYEAGKSMTADGENSGYGAYSLQSLTSGTDNTGIGAGALRLVVTTYRNTGIGKNALSNSVGNSNIAMGWNAGSFLTSENNRLVISSIQHTNKSDDTTKSIIYGLQDATVANQKLYLNANVKVAEHLSYKGTYASIFRHRSLGDTTQSIPTGTTPTKVLAFSTNGQQSNCTADKDNDKITITKTGRYMVNLSLSYASGTNAVNWTAYVFNNGVESDNIHSTGYTATANDKRSTMLSGIINVTSVPADIDYRVTHTSGSAVDLIFTYVNLSVNYIGD